MIVQSEQVSLKHLLTVEALSDQEVMGLIHRGSAFKKGAIWLPRKSQYFIANLFLKIVHVLIKVLKLQKRN